MAVQRASRDSAAMEQRALQHLGTAAGIDISLERDPAAATELRGVIEDGGG